MGWSYRKSFGTGPFRISFSKSGISYSVGVKGARVNVGPRGTYVNLSSHGISYRQKITDGQIRPVPSVPQPVPALYQPNGHNIASADIDRLTDTDSKAFVNELTEKANQRSYVKWLGVFPLIIFLAVMAFTSFESKKIVLQPATDSVMVRITYYSDVNIRALPNARSKVIKAAASEERFPLLDSANTNWLKISIGDSTGYVARHYTAIEHVHHDLLETEKSYLGNRYAGYEVAGGIIFFTVLISKLKKVDKRRFEMALHYEMDEQFKNVYQQFSDHFKTLGRSARIWQYVNAQHTNDYKRTGGAGKLINRLALKGISSNKAPISYFSTNVSIPCLQLSNLEFYFLPERLLVKRGKTFAAVFYKNLKIEGYTTRFIEDESVPHDAQIVGQTWRFVNKQGGPDRRFNNNRQIPICVYSEYTLTSNSGIYEVLTTSKQGAMDEFAAFLKQIGNMQSRMPIN